MSAGFALATLALIVVVAAITVFFRRAMAVRLPARPVLYVAATVAGGVLAVAALVRGAGWIGGALAVLALVGAALFLVMTAIGRQKGDSGAFRVGEPVPDFSAPDDTGMTVALSDFAGAPILLKFFRGHW